MGRMMRYILFAGDRYYPAGGMKDCKGMFETMESAQSFAEGLFQRASADWAHVFDTVEEKVEHFHAKEVF
jgi:hypothetical protein